MATASSLEYERSVEAVLHALHCLPAGSEVHNLWGLLSKHEVCEQLCEDLDSPTLAELATKLEQICLNLGPEKFFQLEGGLTPMIIPLRVGHVEDAPQCQPLTVSEYSKRVVDWLRTLPGNENVSVDDYAVQVLSYDPSEDSSDSDDYSDNSDEDYRPAKFPRLFAYKTYLGDDSAF